MRGLEQSLEFLLASGNAHKAQEFEILFSPTSLDLSNPTQKSRRVIHILPAPRSIEVDETGLTFEENALIKAKAYYDEFKKPVMSDDSGLIVKALPDELGIYSARFGGPGLDQMQRYELLLEKLKGFKSIEERQAYFTCVLCFYLGPSEYYFFEGRVNGFIGFEARGTDGFGYDPVFIPEEVKEIEGKKPTLAMVPTWKEKNSHRARATQKAMQFFKERVCQK